jgi:hypothetical protein
MGEDNGLTEAALVLGGVGTFFGIIASTFGIWWSIHTFKRQGPLPRCHLIYGGVFGNHGVIAPNVRKDVETTVKEMEKARDAPMFDRLVVGAFVANVGRAPLFIDTIDVRAQPSGTGGHNAHLNLEGNIELPIEVPPGGRTRFFASVDLVRGHVELAERAAGAPQQAWFVIGVGAKEVPIGPIPAEIVALGVDPYPPVRQIGG